jgi:hypothetical protein
MDAGLVLVLAVLGVFLLVPLVLAWVSTNPRRWARVERVLGRDLPEGNDRVPRWLPWVGIGAGAGYLALGVFGLLVEEPVRRMAPFYLAQGALFGGIGVGQYLALRRDRAAKGSAEAQVEGRAEPGRPGAGG